jgi:opacity protein-like surface antigen
MRRGLKTKTLQLLVMIWPGLALAGTVVDPKLSLTAEERYDDDVLLRRAGTGLSGELVTKLMPRLGLQLRGRTLESEAWYSPEFQFRHRSRTVLLDHRGGLELRKRISRRNTLSAEAQLWRVSDETTLPRRGIGISLEPVLYGKLELGLESLLSRRLVANARYNLEAAYFYDGVTPAGGVHAPSLELWYRATRRASLGVEYRFQHFLLGSAQSTAHAPTALFRYRITPHATFTARGGPVGFRDAAISGVVPRIHLEASQGGRPLDLSLEVGQDLVGASGQASALWAQYAGAYAGWRLSRPLRIFVGGSLFRNGTAPGDAAEWFGGDSDSDGYAVGAGVEWQLHQRLMVHLLLHHVDQVGGGTGVVSRNVGAVRLVMTAW